VGPDEHCQVIGEKGAGPVGLALPAGAGNAGGSGQMALSAHSVPASRIELQRVDDFTRPGCRAGGHSRNMIFPRSMTPLATDAAFKEGRLAEPVLEAGHGLQAAGMAL